jgi:hypothetical protein
MPGGDCPKKGNVASEQPSNLTLILHKIENTARGKSYKVIEV